MKKGGICAVALCLALALSPALAETYVQPGVFSITGPDGWSVADSLLMNESAPCVSIEMGYYPEQADFNLFSADADAFQDYANRLLVRYADRSGQYLGVVYSTDSSIPFIIGASDASGPFLYAETMARGWAIGLRCYAYQDATFTTYRALTDTEKAQFEQMLLTFTPIR